MNINYKTPWMKQQSYSRKRKVDVKCLIWHPNIDYEGILQGTLHYKVFAPLFDIREAAAAAAVGTIPIETPGFERCKSLQQTKIFVNVCIINQTAYDQQ